MGPTRASLAADLLRLGVSQGTVVMVHASVRPVRPVTGGVNFIVQTLLDAIGPAGTLIAYVDYEPFYDDGDVETRVFDERIAHTARDRGILHETLRT